MKYISTSALAKERGLDPKELFSILKSKNWIFKKNDKWVITKEGKVAGGDMQYNPQYGDYVVWPSNLSLDQDIDAADTITSTTIGKEFEISAQKVNTIFAELGWIEKPDVGGWKLTKFGAKNGGVEMEASSGLPYVIWNKSVLNDKSFLQSISAATGKDYDTNNTEQTERSHDIDEYRQKFPPKYRTQDGHRVRSRAEALIDDYLYRNDIVHAYERRLPGVEEDVLCDFYLPKGKVYIEFWGMEENEKYLNRKQIKLKIYAREGFSLIELNDKDIESIDDVLPKKLIKYGIKIY
jgi:hypothetical protein